MNKTSAEILINAKKIYLDARRNYRDRLLDVGLLLHEAIIAKLREGDGLSEYARIKNKYTREDAVHHIRAAMGFESGHLSRIIATAMTFKLLGDGQSLGELAWLTIYRFSRFIKRVTGTKHCGYGRTQSGESISNLEAWVIRKGLEQRAKSLLKQAVQEQWIHSRAREEIARIIPPKITRIESGRGHESREKVRSNDGRGREKSSTTRQYNNPIGGKRSTHEEEKHIHMNVDGAKMIACVGSPGDVADLCMELVNAAKDPWAVAQNLIGKLQAIKKPRRMAV